MPMISSRLTSETLRVPTVRPRRSTVMRSASLNTNSRSWLTQMTALPASRSSPIISATCADSWTPNAAVGSSSRTIGWSIRIARAIATTWR